MSKIKTVSKLTLLGLLATSLLTGCLNKEDTFIHKAQKTKKTATYALTFRNPTDVTGVFRGIIASDIKRIEDYIGQLKKQGLEVDYDCRQLQEYKIDPIHGFPYQINGIIRGNGPSVVSAIKQLDKIVLDTKNTIFTEYSSDIY